MVYSNTVRQNGNKRLGLNADKSGDFQHLGRKPSPKNSGSAQSKA
jgi:hypothetical protein